MNEDTTLKSNTNFPVTMSALLVDWIVQEEGKKFLEAIRDSDNDELYESRTIIVIIEYLYFKYRKSVL